MVREMISVQKKKMFNHHLFLPKCSSAIISYRLECILTGLIWMRSAIRLYPYAICIFWYVRTISSVTILWRCVRPLKNFVFRFSPLENIHEHYDNVKKIVFRIRLIFLFRLRLRLHWSTTVFSQRCFLF